MRKARSIPLMVDMRGIVCLPLSTRCHVLVLIAAA
jgi:hypothetical protein